MTPVEAVSTALSGQPMPSAAALTARFAVALPAGSVKELAHPALTTSARTP
jgi:hypothetical protein